MSVLPSRKLRALQHPLDRVRLAVLKHIRELVDAEPKYGNEFWMQHDACIDLLQHEETYKIKVELYGEKIWSMEIPVTKVMEDDPQILTKAMFQTLNIAAQVFRARLAKHFPKHIKSVDMAYSASIRERIVTVTFKNGYTTSAPESEALSDLFVARCGMMYDLPNKGKDGRDT